MKLVIVFAFLAMASAEGIEPVELPAPSVPQYEIPDIRPMMIPVEVMEAVRRAELTRVPLDFSDAVKIVDAPVAEDLEVRFVDVGFNVDVPNIEIPVAFFNFMEVPVEAVEPAQDGASVAEDFAVKFVDAPLEDAQPVADDVVPVEADFAVKFVDSPLEEVQAAADDAVQAEAEDFAVKFVDSPLEDVPAVAVDAVPAEAEDFAVKFVNSPLDVEEPIVIQHEPIVLVEEPRYADPRLRGRF